LLFYHTSTRQIELPGAHSADRLTAAALILQNGV
jgi:hypothetical protein